MTRGNHLADSMDYYTLSRFIREANKASDKEALFMIVMNNAGERQVSRRPRSPRHASGSSGGGGLSSARGDTSRQLGPTFTSTSSGTING